jgi:transposase
LSTTAQDDPVLKQPLAEAGGEADASDLVRRFATAIRARGIEAHVIHASSVAVSREHRRAKTDRLDTELLKRAFVANPFGSSLIKDTPPAH